MSESITPPAAPALQFDRAIAGGNVQAAGVVCSACKTSITDEYYHLGGKTFCASCKARVEATIAKTRTPQMFAKALGLGLVAAIAGAIIYYGVIALLNLEIGIVAILIGYMVGWAIRRVTGGFGARRYQVLGAVLTYLAIGMAYFPLAMRGFSERASRAADSAHVIAKTPLSAKTDSAAAATETTAPVGQVKVERVNTSSMLLGIVAIIGLSLALPIMMILGSMPSGLLSAIIIGIGLRQAWRMTAAPDLSFTGPHRVAAPSAPSDPAGAPA